jgi:hypothetical protein
MCLNQSCSNVGKGEDLTHAFRIQFVFTERSTLLLFVINFIIEYAVNNKGVRILDAIGIGRNTSSSGLRR